MKEAQGFVKMYLLNNTNLTERDHEIKFHSDNIVHAAFQVTLSDGSVHCISVPEIETLTWTLFENNDTDSKKKSLDSIA